MGQSAFTGYGDDSVAALAQAIARIKSADPLAPVTVVPPGNHSGLDLRRRLGREGGLVNVRFMVLARLAEFVGVGTVDRERGRPLVAPLRIEAVRATLAQEPSLFDAVARHPSTVAAMDACFRELAEIPAQELDRLAGGSARSAAVVKLFRRFQRLTRSYYDRPTLFDAAAEAASADPASLRDVGEVVLFLPDRLTPAMLRFLAALRRAGGLTAFVGLSGDEAVDADFVGLGRHLGAEAGLARGTAPVAGQIMTATDPDEEVRTVAALVLQALEQGIAASAIACYYADRGVYRSLLIEQLSATGIRLNEPAGEPFASTPPGRLLLGLIRLAREGLSRRAVVDWLSAAPLRDGPRRVPVRIWNRLSREAGIVGGDAERWRVSLDHHATELAARREDALEQGRDGAAAGYDREIENCGALAAFIESLEVSLQPPASSRWSDWLAWAKDRLLRYLDVTADTPATVDALIGTLDELAGLDELNATVVDSAETFEGAVAQTLARPLPPPSRFGDGVFVAPIGLAPGVFFERTFVLGVVQGQFPGSDREDPLLSDRDRSLAASLGQGIHRSRALRRAYLAALAASASATVSYPEASLRIGRKQLPSRWLLESASHHERATVDAEAFGAIRARPWLVRQISMSARLASGLPFLTDTEFDLADIRHGAGIGAVAGRNTSFAAGLELARGRRSSLLTRYDGAAGTAGREMFPDRVSPTRLERWARCPFQYFAGDVLRVAEFDEPEEVRVLSALDRGTIIHDALDAFYRESADRPAGPWTDHERARLSDLALARCSSFEQLGRTGHGALWNIERARILSDLADFLDADEARSAELGTRFYAGELAFGDAGGGLPAASIELPDGRAVEFRGRIDRVDRIGDTDEYWVYDYKTGSSYGMNRLDADPLLGGQRLQLPIYGEAVRAALGAKGVRAGYWFVSATQGFRLREVPLDEATRSQLRVTLATIREGIAAGMFVAHPGSGNGNCTYCPYDSLCVTDRERAFRRKSDDDAMAPYLALSEPPA